MKKGFTVIELVVVISIMAILALILVPQVTGYINNANKAVCMANFKTMESEYQLNAMDDDNLSLTAYLDSLTAEEKDICPLCPLISTDGANIVCAGERVVIHRISDLNTYDNRVYQQYLTEDESLTTKEYQDYVKAHNQGSFYQMTDEQVEELTETGLTGWDGNGRISTKRLNEEDYYYRPVIVNGEVAQVLTNDGEGGNNASAFYYKGQYYYYVHTYGGDLFEGGAVGDRYYTGEIINEEKSILNIVEQVAANDGYYVISSGSRAWTTRTKE